MSKRIAEETRTPAPTMPDDEGYRAEADFLARVLAHPDVPIDFTELLGGRHH